MMEMIQRTNPQQIKKVNGIKRKLLITGVKQTTIRNPEQETPPEEYSNAKNGANANASANANEKPREEQMIKRSKMVMNAEKTNVERQEYEVPRSKYKQEKYWNRK